jgi:hypothetical protein
MPKQKIRDISGKVIGEIDENAKSVYEIVKDIKKDINKAFENLPEGHLPGYNFMGPFTKNDDRLSLNWKGRRGGHVDYFLPTNREDYISFKHDLGYYAPSNVVKSYFDLEMLKAITKSKSDRIEKIGAFGGITLAYLRRLTEELGYSGMYLLASKSAYDSTLGYVRNVMNNPALSTSSALLHSFVYPSILFGSGFLGRPVKHLADGVNKIYSLFGETKQYKKIKDPLNKVMEKYDKYLESVGSFKKDKPRKVKPQPAKGKILKMIEPGINKIFEAIESIGDEREEFKLKKNIDKEQSIKLYIDFYNEFNEYKKVINDVFRDQEGFKPYEIIPLNQDNLFLVADPYYLPQTKKEVDDMNELILKLMKSVRTTETGEMVKRLDEEIDKLTKKKELSEEVIKVLEDKILQPFETPATELEEYKKEKEKEKEEEKEKETKLKNLSHNYDDDEKEEIEKILKEEIEKPLETPIQIKNLNYAYDDENQKLVDEIFG